MVAGEQTGWRVDAGHGVSDTWGRRLTGSLSVVQSSKEAEWRTVTEYLLAKQSLVV